MLFDPAIRTGTADIKRKAPNDSSPSEREESEKEWLDNTMIAAAVMFARNTAIQI
ncbi:MAG: hypothetical protein WC397_02175 [Candidatus Paceibacterota bacterium]